MSSINIKSKRFGKNMSVLVPLAEIDVSPIVFAYEMFNIYNKNSNVEPSSEVRSVMNKLVAEIKRDKTLTGIIHSIIIRRLKYATGNLLKSLRIHVEYSYKPSEYSKTQKSETGLGGRRQLSQASGFITIYFGFDPALREALLGEREVATKVPTEQALAGWIRGKQKYFRERIDAIERYQAIRRAAQRQRELLSRRAKVETRFEVLRDVSGEKLKDPVAYMAGRIRVAMESRFKDMGSATKGSEYIFLGHQRKTGKFAGAEFEYFDLKYKKVDSPLITMDYSGGELITELRSAVEAYVRPIFAKWDIDVLTAKKQKIDAFYAGNNQDNLFFESVKADLDAGIKNAIFVCEQTRRMRGKSAREHYNKCRELIEVARGKQISIILREQKVFEKAFMNSVLDITEQIKRESVSAMSGASRFRAGKK